jgi:YidC/Oxa1 family membrane protein insertase
LVLIFVQGLNKVLNTAKPLDLEWNLKANRNEKSISYENKYTEIYFEHKDGKVDYAGLGALRMSLKNQHYIAFKQHFFSTILVSKTPFEKTRNIN